MTRVVNSLGIPAGRSLLPPLPENPKGFWEVEPIMMLDDELLEHLGGSWDAPPAPDPGWEHGAGFDVLCERARDLFTAEHPGDTWVWKDPRACVLLPFWKRVLGPSHALLIVLRHPSAVAASLLHRDVLAVELGLAIWERSLRHALRDAAGMPALVVDYDGLVDAPARTVREITDFVRRWSAVNTDADGMGELVRRELRHQNLAELSSLSRLSPNQEALHRASRALLGEHDALPETDLPAETPSVPLVLSARRHGNLVPRRALRDGGVTAWPDPDGLIAHHLALDRALIRIGELERQADLDGAVLRDLADALGHAELGRVELASLHFARLVRRIQRRVGRG